MIRGKELKRPPEKKVTLDMSIHNRFDIEVIDAKTGKAKRTAVGYNTICDNLWACMFSNTVSSRAYFKGIHFGKGSGSPSVSDTDLFSRVGAKKAIYDSNYYDYKTGVFCLKQRIQLLENEFVGETITEVGISFSEATSPSARTLCTHAMLQDMNGNQISILKTDSDIINIYASIFVHTSPTGYDNGTIWPLYKRECLGVVSGGHQLKTLAFTSTLFSYLSGYYDSGIGGLTLSKPMLAGFIPNFKSDGGVASTYPYGYVYGSNTGSFDLSITYDLPNKKINLKSRISAALYNNIGGVQAILPGGEAAQFILLVKRGASWFSHSTIENEVVGVGDGVTKDFPLKFSLPSNVKVFFDGVETTDIFTVDYDYYYYGNSFDESNGGFYKANSRSAFFMPIRKESTLDNIIPAAYGGVIYKHSLVGAGENLIFYNLRHMQNSLKKVKVQGTKLAVSNDLENWTDIQIDTTAAVTLDEQYWNSKFIKVTTNYNTDSSNGAIICTGDGLFIVDDEHGLEQYKNNLHFENPPAEGVAISASYEADCIAKDENHVFDLTLEIQLQEYTVD